MGFAGSQGAVGPIGVQGATGPTGAPGAWVVISDQTLSVDSANVTFNSIPGNYNHLVLISYGRQTAASPDNYYYLQFNADTGNNYDREDLITFGTADSATSEIGVSSLRLGDMPARNSARPTQAGGGMTFIPNYAGTAFEKGIASSAYNVWGTLLSTVASSAYSGGWRNTAAITRIDVLAEAGNNFKAGSRFTLYGF
jgi:hypothetical protein